VGFKPLKKDAADGGAVAGRTRKDIERRTGRELILNVVYETKATYPIISSTKTLL